MVIILYDLGPGDPKVLSHMITPNAVSVCESDGVNEVLMVGKFLLAADTGTVFENHNNKLH